MYQEWSFSVVLDPVVFVFVVVSSFVSVVVCVFVVLSSVPVRLRRVTVRVWQRWSQSNSPSNSFNFQFCSRSFKRTRVLFSFFGVLEPLIFLNELPVLIMGVPIFSS